MHRRSFLSSDFFLAITEADAKRLLTSLPGYLSQLTLLTETRSVQAIRFSYVDNQTEAGYLIDVSLCPLDSYYLRFGVHASHRNGQVIQAQAGVRQALQFFEEAVRAAYSQDMDRMGQLPAATTQKRTPGFLQNFFSLFLSKHHY